MSYFVYILECSDGSLYTGITTDLSRRLKEHNSPSGGAKYTRARQPVVLVYFEPAISRSEATRRENEIKQLKVGGKKTLVASGCNSNSTKPILGQPPRQMTP